MSANLPPIANTLKRLELIDESTLPVILNPDNDTTEKILISAIENNLVAGNKIAETFSQNFGSPAMLITEISIDHLPLDLIDLSLADKHLVLPIYKKGSTLFVAISDPTDATGIDKIKFNTGMSISTIQCNPVDIKRLANIIRGEQQGSLDDFIMEGDNELQIEEEDEEEQALDEQADSESAPIVQYVNKILIDSINRGASDIHIEPFEKKIRVRFRIDGVLHNIASQPASLAPQIIARVKIISKLDISEKRAPQDGRVKVKLSSNRAIDFRVNTLPTVWGEKAVMRLLDSSAANLDLNVLGFSEQQLALYKETVARPYGMVLITGPTGSGKTVTLYSALNMLNDPSKNISTVEDPVEIQLEGITQVNINEKAGLNFASALRAFLRQDPDILMLGEIRDLETAEIAIKASQTGHMVLSTLHTNDAPATLTRLLNMGIPAFNIASAVQLILAQRLARKLCKTCKQEVDLPDTVLLKAGFKEDEIQDLTIFKAKGCDNCTQGYKGRVGVFQVMPVTEEIKTLIMQDCTEQDIEKAALEEGIDDLRLSGLKLVKQGLTTLEEIERVTNV